MGVETWSRGLRSKILSRYVLRVRHDSSPPSIKTSCQTNVFYIVSLVSFITNWAIFVYTNSFCSILCYANDTYYL